MTAIRTSLQNAFETQITGSEMGPNDLTVDVATKGALTSPCYLVIDPDSDSLREYIYFDGSFGASSFVTTNIANRYLPGSAAGSNLTHAIGAFVRIVPMSQHFEDIHDRIDAIDHSTLVGLSNDDHPQYSLVDGTRAFTGAVAGITPSVGADLTTKTYVDAQVAGGVPPGVIMPYGAASAPSGYLLCDGDEVSRATYNPLFLVIGTNFGVGDGSTTFDLPDLRGRFPLGLAVSGTGSSLGDTGGSLDSTINIAHSHTVNSHSHTINHGHSDSFTTASDGHTHTMGTHTHATSIDHNHGSVSSSTVGSHNHSFSDTSGGPSSTDGPFNLSGITLAGSNTHTHFVSGTTGSNSSHFHSVDLPNYDASNVTSTAVDPGNTNSDSHSHTVNGSVTSHSGSSSSTSPGTNSTLSSSQAIPNPPFLAVEYIIKL